MGISKYNIEERRIARLISVYRVRQKEAQKRYDFYELKINVCISKLNGKYGRNGKY